MAAVSLVDIGALDLAPGEPLGVFDDAAQRVTIVRITGQCPGVHHEPPSGRSAIGGDDGGLHTELVRGAGFAPADALHLRSVEGIELPAALALLLGADLIGARQWPGERFLELLVACDFAPDVAHDPAQPDAQNPQL